MAIDQPNTIDFISINEASGELCLSIVDHLAWDDEGIHLSLLQDKLNTYLNFIESGELFEKYPHAKGNHIIINLMGKFLLSQQADSFLEKVRGIIIDTGIRLEFSLLSAH